MTKLAVVIHDLSPWGGQDKSVLEITERLEKNWPTTYFCYSKQGSKTDSKDSSCIFIKPHFRKPVLFKSIYFYLTSYFKLKSFKNKNPHSLIHATGSCSWMTDIIQVQFLHAAWGPHRHSVLRKRGFVFFMITQSRHSIASWNV